MRRNLRCRSRGPIAALVVALSLLVAAAALAAKPLRSKTYTGVTSGQAVYGFKPYVKFRVSSNRKQLLAFNWGGSCLAGPKPPNGRPPQTFVHPVGTIMMHRNDKFSIKNAKQTLNFGPNGTFVNISTVNGYFKTSRTATGTIKYTQEGFSVQGASLGKCSRKVSFTANTP